jgi:hypothetical protein
VVGASVAGTVVGTVEAAGVTETSMGAVCELAGESALEVCEHAESPASALEASSHARAVRVEVIVGALGREDRVHLHTSQRSR